MAIRLGVTTAAEQGEPPQDDAEDDLFSLEAGEEDEGVGKVISARASPKKHLPEPAEEEREDIIK